MGDLLQNSEIIASVGTKEDLEQFAELTLEKMKSSQNGLVSNLVLQYLGNNILSKLFLLVEQGPLSQSVLSLIKYLSERQLISPIF